jgi:hypothetical protein
MKEEIMEKSKTKLSLEKDIFSFTALRVWREIFPIVMDLEVCLADVPDGKKERLFKVLQDLLEFLVSGYYEFHLVEKYLSYQKARKQCGIALFLIYQMGFHKIMEKEKVLDFGKRLAECIKICNSLIKNIENNIRRMNETKFLMERIKSER